MKPKGGAPLPGNYHLGLIVKDLQATLRALQARGYPVPPEAFKQATRLLPDNTYNYFIKDPDGNKIELSQPTPEAAEFKFGIVLKLPGNSPTPESPAPAQQPGATPGGLPPSLQAKIARLQALAEKREAEGFDMAPVAAVADGVQPLIDQKKYTEAEAQVDRALKLLGETTPQEQPRPQSQTGPPQSLQQKVHRLQALIERREQEGADMQPVGELMEELDPLLRQQKYTEAEALVDRALKLLGESTPEGQGSSHDAKHP
jgi:negative regulator of replication initiation